jgi:hypothetical protein
VLQEKQLEKHRRVREVSRERIAAKSARHEEMERGHVTAADED